MAPRATEAEQKFSSLSHSNELYSVTSPLSGKNPESCLTDYWFSGYTIAFLVENGSLSLVKLLMEMSFFFFFFKTDKQKCDSVPSTVA